MELSEKELSVIQDLLNEEELLVKKFTMLANHSQDETVKQQMLDIARSIRDILMEFILIWITNQNLFDTQAEFILMANQNLFH